MNNLPPDNILGFLFLAYPQSSHRGNLRVVAIFRLRQKNPSQSPLGGPMIREKNHRLPLEAYRGFVAVSLTACIKNRDKFFTTRDRFTVFKNMLLNALKQFGCGAEIYLFMPDHAHMVLRGESETADVWRAMKSFKQQSGFWLSRNHPSVLWQKDFYDHILRNDESFERHIRYILNNPAREGLVEDWRDYPFKGSTVKNFDEWD